MDLKSLLFSFEGRIGRSQYILTALAKGVVYGMAMLLVMGLFLIKLALIAIPLMIVLAVLSIWTSFALMVKRVHDRDHSGYYSLLAFVPFANIWLAIESIFLRGTIGDNQFGKDPVA